MQHFDPNASPSGMAVGAGAVWISDNEADNVTRVDPSGLLTPIAVGNGPAGIAVGEDAVWVADSLDDAVVRIDPIANAVTAKIPVGRSPAGVAIGDGSVWVANTAMARCRGSTPGPTRSPRPSPLAAARKRSPSRTDGPG